MKIAELNFSELMRFYSAATRRNAIRSALGLAVGAPGIAMCASASLSASSIVTSRNFGLPRELSFPRDFGAHPGFQTEWWYVTGHAPSGDGAGTLGFQVTFFRSKVASTQGSSSKLAAKHLLFAHAAVSDVAGKTLHSDQRIAGAASMESSHNPACSR